ncbi:MAG: hypothetical protein CMM94_05580 [Rickettsiales bacterium]|nr:hypothetical protein [Rickettsiales bacterium]
MQSEHRKPRWISWLLLGFLLLLIIRALSAEPTPDAPREAPASQKTTKEPPASVVEKPKEKNTPTIRDYPEVQKLVDIDRWRRTINPAEAGEMRVGSRKQGDGESAECGDDVIVDIRGILPDGSAVEIPELPTMPASFRLGESTLDKKWTQIVLGMREGGIRDVSLPHYMIDPSVERKDALRTVQLYVELADRLPDPSITEPAAMSQTRTEGGGQTVACGQTAEVRLTIWREGEPSDTIEAELQLGARELLYGLDRAIAGMQMDEKRSVLIPASYAVRDEGSALDEKILSLIPTGQTTIVDVELIGYTENKSTASTQ